MKAKTTGYNQDGKTVITFGHTLLVYRRGRAPEVPRPEPESPRFRRARLAAGVDRL